MTPLYKFLLVCAVVVLANATPPSSKAIKKLFKGKDDKMLADIFLAVLKEKAFAKDHKIGGRRVESLDYYRVVPEEALIVAGISGAHKGVGPRVPRFPCTAVIYIVKPIFTGGPPALEDNLEFDPSRDIQCMELREVFQRSC